MSSFSQSIVHVQLRKTSVLLNPIASCNMICVMLYITKLFPIIFRGFHCGEIVLGTRLLHGIWRDFMLYSQLPVVAPGNAIEIRDSSYYDHSDKSHNKTTLLMNIVSKSYNPNSHYYWRENCKTRYIPSAFKGASRWIMQYHLIVHYYITWKHKTPTRDKKPLESSWGKGNPTPAPKFSASEGVTSTHSDNRVHTIPRVQDKSWDFSVHFSEQVASFERRN